MGQKFTSRILEGLSLVWDSVEPWKGIGCGGDREAGYIGRPLVLLRHEFLRRDGFAITELQQGHRGRLLTRAPISRRRMVAIEFGM